VRVDVRSGRGRANLREQRRGHCKNTFLTRQLEIFGKFVQSPLITERKQITRIYIYICIFEYYVIYMCMYEGGKVEKLLLAADLLLLV